MFKKVIFKILYKNSKENVLTMIYIYIYIIC